MENPPNTQTPFESRDLFDAFKRQLAKDFQQSNFPNDFVAALEPDYGAILDTVASELQRNEKHADNHLMSLLYRIDISEGQFKRHLEQNKDEPHLRVIAELIIKRILQKVVIRQYYKNNSSS